mgnify:CR=1 FL=1
MSPTTTIFLADDDIDDCVLFEDALSEICAKSKLIIAKNGIELIHLLESIEDPIPDVIFLDLNMPKKNGFECLAEIRENSGWKHIPIVIFSTSCTDDMLQKVYQCGANFFIKKPGSFPILKQSIEQILTTNWDTHIWKPNTV